MSFKRKRVEYIGLKEWEKHLNFCRKNRVLVNGPRTDHNCMIANVEVKITEVSLTYRLADKTTTYISRLDDTDMIQEIDGALAFATLKKYYKVPDLREESMYGYQLGIDNKARWFVASTKHLQYYNPKYDETRTENCIGYDLNSAFSYAMLQPIPDTSVRAITYGLVHEGQIGFQANGDVVFSGPALYVFPLMESPFKRFIDVWYGRKQSIDKKLHNKAKQMLNYCVGYLQRVNPFIRNCIVSRSNKLIESLIDENTLYCNTDSIVSKVRRKDIEANLGHDIGQWKIEHMGSFAYRKYTYQWGFKTPTYKGVPKGWFKSFEKENGRCYDMLKDQRPNESNNLAEFDEKNFKLIWRN